MLYFLTRVRQKNNRGGFDQTSQRILPSINRFRHIVGKVIVAVVELIYQYNKIRHPPKYSIFSDFFFFSSRLFLYCTVLVVMSLIVAQYNYLVYFFNTHPSFPCLQKRFVSYFCFDDLLLYNIEHTRTPCSFLTFSRSSKCVPQ